MTIPTTPSQAPLPPLAPRDAKLGGPAGAPLTAAERAKVSAAFGSILMRQMLDPVVEPMLKGLQGSAPGGGGGMYSQLIKDALISSLSQSGTGGIAANFERQFSPPAPAMRANDLQSK